MEGVKLKAWSTGQRACTLLQRSASTLALPFLRQVRFTPVMPCLLSDARSSGASSNTCWQEQSRRVVQLHCDVQCSWEAELRSQPTHTALLAHGQAPGDGA